MPYLNVDDGMDEHPKVETLSDAEHAQLFRDIFTWSRTGEASPLVRELIDLGLVRRAPRHWLPEPIRPSRKYRAPIPDEIRVLVYSRDGWRCRNCRGVDDLTLDHIVPWSIGGTDDHTNLQTLCRSCNSRKGARI